MAKHSASEEEFKKLTGEYPIIAEEYSDFAKIVNKAFKTVVAREKKKAAKKK